MMQRTLLVRYHDLLQSIVTEGQNMPFDMTKITGKVKKINKQPNSRQRYIASKSMNMNG